MAFTGAPFPAQDDISERGGKITNPWIEWFTGLMLDVDTSPTRLPSVTVPPVSASIGVTSVPLGALASGLYRATFFARVTTPATTSSSLTVSIGATDDGVAYTFTSPAMTGNTTATVGSESYLLKVDQGTPIVYSTTWSSVGGVSMAYSLSVVVEAVEA